MSRERELLTEAAETLQHYSLKGGGWAMQTRNKIVGYLVEFGLHSGGEIDFEDIIEQLRE